MYKILSLNNISVAGLDRLPRENYEIASEIQHPDAILLRSASMHDYPVPESLLAVGRAGAGVNNIPIDKLSARGIPVFNTPGANANAVLELVISGLFLAARNICRAWDFNRGLTGDDKELSRQVEAHKKQFVGFELPGRTLGIIGLGAIGSRVANVAIGLGMNVIGYDTKITVERAWKLSSEIQQAASIGDLLARSDFVSVHVPLVEENRKLINVDRIRMMREGATLLNFARQGIVDDEAVVEALDEGRLHTYVTDFPTELLQGRDRVICLPHLGASTREAEDNCAIMVADQVRAFLEDGNIRNSVNFPEAVMPRNSGYRIVIVNANVPNMLGQISTTLAEVGLNIIDMLNKSKDGLAYTVIDVEQSIPDAVVETLSAIEGVLTVRTL